MGQNTIKDILHNGVQNERERCPKWQERDWGMVISE